MKYNTKFTNVIQSTDQEKLCYSAMSNDKVEISIRPEFIGVGDDDSFIWVYFAIIKNNLENSIQLLNVGWDISGNSNLSRKIIEESDEIYKNHLIKPGIAYEYTNQIRVPWQNSFGIGIYNFQNIIDSKNFSVSTGLLLFENNLPTSIN